MSRQIKFRVWDKKNKEFFYPKEFRVQSGQIGWTRDHYLDIDERCEHDRYILEQYTGINDVDGQEIYEGDLIIVLENDNSILYTVEYLGGEYKAVYTSEPDANNMCKSSIIHSRYWFDYICKEESNSYNRISCVKIVSNVHAVSSADLAEALSRVGASAKDAGVTFNELIALVTSAQQVTARGGSVIGNSFKTLFTRLQRNYKKNRRKVYHHGRWSIENVPYDGFGDWLVIDEDEAISGVQVVDLDEKWAIIIDREKSSTSRKIFLANPILKHIDT